jgi:hypothetical protein
MAKKAKYAYSIQPGTEEFLDDQSGEKFAPNEPGAETVVSNAPDRKSMRYVGKGDFTKTDMDVTKAGAGRGKKGGPTAKELGGMKKGGSVRSASQRADGCAQRGKTRA